MQLLNVFDVQIKATYVRLEGAAVEAGPWNILFPLCSTFFVLHDFGVCFCSENQKQCLFVEGNIAAASL